MKKATAKKLMPKRTRSKTGKVLVTKLDVNSLESSSGPSKFFNKRLPDNTFVFVLLATPVAHAEETESNWPAKLTSKSSVLIEGKRRSA